jgi:hypothetical protein
MSMNKTAYDIGVQLGLQQFEKTALLSRLLKPIGNSYKGKALADRIAPLGWKRIGSEIGHGLGDMASGAGVAALLGGGADDMLIAGGVTSAIGNQLNQVRANKYLDKALKGSSALNKGELKYLKGEMGDLNTYLGADSLHELLGGSVARRRVSDALKKKIL